MKAVVFHGIGDIRLDNVPEPKIEGGSKWNWNRSAKPGGPSHASLFRKPNRRTRDKGSVQLQSPAWPVAFLGKSSEVLTGGRAMNPAEMEETVHALIAPGKGILAADESTPTITKRFETIGLASTQENRRAYREMLFTTADLGEFISGTILFDETIRQQARDGTPLPELLRQQGIIPGIKVDQGAKPLALFPGEKITQGLDGLRERLEEYVALGARFTKWRGVIRIAAELPTHTCLAANAHALVRFAATSQETGLVPIVEPEVLMGGDHTLERCAEVTKAMLRLVFRELAGHRVRLEQMLLKVNMVLPGQDCSRQANVLEVAEATLRCLRETVPPAVPAIVFLSGGQPEVLATQHLNAMNQMNNAPWQLSFSYGRALQGPALKAWGGSDIRAGQSELRHRARCNSAARSGRYSGEMEGGQRLAA